VLLVLRVNDANVWQLNVTNSIGKIFEEAEKYPMYSAAHGHTYTKPVQKVTTQKETSTSQQSKESTPMPGLEGPGADKPITGATMEKAEKEAESRTLLQALQMTTRHGKEYSDEVPLTGEPGNFRFSKKGETGKKAAGAATVAPSVMSESRAGTPAVTRPPSRMPIAR
jgi:mediator of RNA polymerase II transcription subunit 6